MNSTGIKQYKDKQNRERPKHNKTNTTKIKTTQKPCHTAHINTEAKNQTGQ